MRANISGERIRFLREKFQLGQVELAVALNLDYGINLAQSDISEIERGVRGVKDFELDAFSKFFEVDVVWLLRGDL